MKISELIEVLKREMAAHGDVPVHTFGCQDETTSEAEDVYFTDYFKEPRVVITR